MARLFQSLVVCGAGLTLLDCGGRYAHDGSGDPSSSNASGNGAISGAGQTNAGGSAPSGSGGASTQAGTTPSNGGLTQAGTSAGGFASTTGGSASTTGGSASTTGGGPVMEPFGARAQLECDPGDVSGCASIDTDPSQLVFGLNVRCSYNAMRPRGPEDCTTGQMFTCLVGEYAGKTSYFNCECQFIGNEQCACPPIGLGCLTPVSSLCGDRQTYCGCAYTCILK